MQLDELAYIVVGSAKIAEWRIFAQQIMGAMIEDRACGDLFIKLDEWHHRIVVTPYPEEKFLHSGWSVRNLEIYEQALAEAGQHGLDVRIGTQTECDNRTVAGLFRIVDPAGNSHEICWGREMAPLPFVSPVGTSAFVTGDLGLGHVVLPCSAKFDEAIQFYERVMGLAYSDFFVRTSADGGRRRVYFFHCANERQHSLAIGEGESPTGLRHFMCEVATLDDVGRALDRVCQAGDPLARTLGRHVNDAMVSFYVTTPSGFAMEYGCGGERMDWTGHRVVQISDGSYWGHKWL